MSELALQLIAENKKTKAPYLDLGNCGLKSLPHELFDCVWLEALVLSNIWWDYEKREWIDSGNKGAPNSLSEWLTGISALKQLKILRAGGDYLAPWKISDASFLQSLIGLQTLDLSRNQILDASYLKSLTGLQTLGLSGNQISDASFLQSLTVLQNLDLGNNQISDLSYLKSLTVLQTLDLSRNQISDASFLQSLTGLQTLYLSYNQILDASFLQSLTGLQTLYLSYNQISDLSYLKSLTGLQTLGLSRNQISDLSYLKSLTGLKSLDLSDNQISDLSYLKSLTGLQTLYLSGNQISDAGFLQSLTGLQKLDLSDNQISDLSYLKSLTGLQTLYLSNNQISDLSYLKSLTGLQTLYLGDNQISDLSYLKSLTGLQTLDLSRNQILDASYLKSLTGLQTLYLSGNQISDASFLQSLTGLQTLDLGNNQISDASDLYILLQLKALKYVSLQGNKVISKIPPEVMDVGWTAIKEWLAAAQPGQETAPSLSTFKEIKLLLLGNANVGKSNLLEYFETGKEPELNDQTHGIRFKVISNFIEGANMNCWDFGGQEYFHATHKLFFSPGALHIVLWSCKDVQRDSDNPESCFDLNYWFRCIDQLSGTVTGSQDVIVAENKIDLNGYSASKINQEDLAGRFAGLDLQFINFNLKPLRRLAGFKELITERAEKLYRELPQSYSVYLKKIRDSSAEFLLLENIDIVNNETAGTAMEVFHAMGLLLFFPKIIPGKIFIRPQSLLHLLYNNVLSSKKEPSITRVEIEEAIRDNSLQLNTTEVIQLLKAFDLAFEIPGEKDVYFIPQYLKPPTSIFDFFEKHQFPKANIIISSDSFLMNLAMLKIFSFYGRDVKGKSSGEYLFWKDGIVIEKGNMLLLVKFNRQLQRIELFPDLLNKNFALQKELVHFILSASTNSNTPESLLQAKLTEPGSKRIKDGINNPLLENRTVITGEGINWETTLFSILISLDGDYFIKWSELIEQRDKGIFQIEATCSNINPETKKHEIKKKAVSVFDYNLYLPNNKKGEVKKIFISYSKEDLKPVNKFIEHLSALKTDGKIAAWYCTELTAGSDWNAEIQANFEEADIVCFMISPNFMKTKYIHEHEIKKAFEKKEKNKDFKIVPVILDYCRWETQNNNLTKYTGLPYMSTPVACFNNENKAWYIIEECLRVMIEKDLQPEGGEFYSATNTPTLPKDVLRILEQIARGEVNK